MIYETFFDKLQLTTERVILAEDVDLGTEPKAIMGKFYFPMLTPTIDMNNPYDQTDEVFKSDNIHGVTINKKPFTRSNYIELEIPVHIQFQYFYKQQQECLDKLNAIKENRTNIGTIIMSYALLELSDPFDIYKFKNFLVDLGNELLKEEEEDDISSVVIKAGTEFIITGIGTSIEYDDLRIIGIWTEETTPNVSITDDEEDKDDDNDTIEFNPYNYGDDQPNYDDINNVIFTDEEEDDEDEVIDLPVYNYGDDATDPYSKDNDDETED